MRRFFLPPGSLQGRRLVFEDRDARYIFKVLRMKRGESIIAFDGRGNEYIGVIAILSSRRVEAVISEVRHPKTSLLYRVALAQAVLKGPGMDAVIRQTTELGISDFYPIMTRHCIGRIARRLPGKEDRWAKIAIDAARQSGQSVTPTIHPPHDWKRLLGLGARFDLCLLPWEKERKQSLKAALGDFPPESPPEKILVVIGPEGGFSDPEVKEAVEAGFRPVNLGPTILRATTAGVVVVASINYHFQRR